MKNRTHLLILLALAAIVASCKTTTGPQSANPILISGGNDLLIAGNRAFVLANGSNTVYSVNLSQIPSSDRDLLILAEGNFGKTNSTLNSVLFEKKGSQTDTALVNNILPDSVSDVYSSIPIGLEAPNKMALIALDTLLVTRRNSTSAALIDLSSSHIVDSIPLGCVSIAVAVLNNKAYVTTGVTEYGGPYHLTIYDLESHKIIKTISLPESPEQALADSSSGNVIIGMSGDGSTTSSELYFVNATNDAIVDSLTPGSPADDPELTTGSKHFIIMGTKVYALTGATHVLPPPLINGSVAYYKGMYDSSSNALYLGNPGDYTNPGTVDAYDATTGKLLWSRPAGIIPGHFAFYH